MWNARGGGHATPYDRRRPTTGDDVPSTRIETATVRVYPVSFALMRRARARAFHVSYRVDASSRSLFHSNIRSPYTWRGTTARVFVCTATPVPSLHGDFSKRNRQKSYDCVHVCNIVFFQK